MRHLGFFFCLCFSLTAFATDNASLCVQTFNTYGPAYARHKKERTEALAASLHADNPPCDILQFQELWRESYFDRLKSSLDSLRYLALFNDSYRNDGYSTGLASFFQGSVAKIKSLRYEVNNESGLLDLFRGLLKVAKGFTLIEAKIDSAPETILLINTHTHPTETSIRLAQMLQLVKATITEAPAGEPIIFTADLNSTPDSPEMALLKNLLLLQDSYLELHGTYAGICTYCEKNPLSWSSEDRVIDYVLYRNRGVMKLLPISSEVNLQNYQGLILSDHYGVRTHFRSEIQPSSIASTISAEQIKVAQKTLLQVKSILQKAGDEYLTESLKTIDGFLADLNSRNENSALFRYWKY